MINWIENRSAGLYCIPGDFFVDPQRGVARAVVSHAHSDHYPRYCHEVHGTVATMAIGRLRYLNNAAKIEHAHEFRKPFYLGPVRITFYGAGHILGSAQILLEYEGQRVLYTGDIGFDANPTCEPLEFPEQPLDLVICESTFGEKEEHPSPEAALQQCLQEAGKRPIMIATYILGKAQRINRILQDHRPDMPVFVDRTISPIHKLYQQFGMNPGRHVVYRRQDVKRLHVPYIWLLPPKKLTGFAADRLYHKVFASGWDNTDRAAWLNGRLEISDHASQREIEAYLLRLKPKAVRFWHGYPKSLIATCLAHGIDAAELAPSSD